MLRRTLQWFRIAITFLLISYSCLASVVINTNPFPLLDPFGTSPYWNWKTIETEHFRISFPEELTTISQRAAHYLEEAHQLLSPLMKWDPGYRVQILIVDNQDSANGLTSPEFGLFP